MPPRRLSNIPAGTIAARRTASPNPTGTLRITVGSCQWFQQIGEALSNVVCNDCSAAVEGLRFAELDARIQSLNVEAAPRAAAC